MQDYKKIMHHLIFIETLIAWAIAVIFLDMAYIQNRTDFGIIAIIIFIAGIIHLYKTCRICGRSTFFGHHVCK